MHPLVATHPEPEAAPGESPSTSIDVCTPAILRTNPVPVSCYNAVFSKMFSADFYKRSA